MNTSIKNYKDGDVIITRPKFSPVTALREVVYKNGGVIINNHWFSWYSFFQVNILVE